MKTILIATDLSGHAAHAAEFGYQFAKQIKGNVILCNAFTVPVEVPQSNLVVWPMYEYDEISHSCADEVEILREKLELIDKHGFNPEIKCVNEAGALEDVIADITTKHDIGLIVMGTHGGGLSSLMLGNHTRRMINITTRPLLLIPAEAKNVSIKKIAFATDLDNIADDLDAIYELITYAKMLNAEILLTYVDDDKYHNEVFKKHMENILTILSNKANYPLIYYRVVKSHNVESGLNWLCENGQVDMLAMVHRPHNFLDDLITGSHTQKMANHVEKPLLVFPAKG